MLKVLLMGLMLLEVAFCLGAEVYPSKPVRVVASFGPGGTDDLVARIISQQLSEQLGKSFVVENRVGATGTIGYEYVAKSAPDGYTLLTTNTAATMVPGLNKSLRYDVAKDFTAITQITRTPQVLVINPSLNVNTLKQFIALAQASQGKLNYGSGGTGGAIHLISELFKLAAKVNIAHIPYKGGGGDTMTALLGNQIQMVTTVIPTVLPHVKSGRLRALAVTTDGRRVPTMSDVPSMSEAGVSGMTVYIEFGLAGPAGMPKELVNKLHDEVVKAIAVPSVKEQFVAQGAELVGSSPEEFSVHIRNELQRWAEVIKSAGITLEQ